MEKMRIYDLGCRELIDLKNGSRIGYAADAEVDIETGRVISLVVPGRLRFFGLLGREPDVLIPWERIERIGDDMILVGGDRE